MYEQNNLFKKEKLTNNFYYYIRSKVTMVDEDYESTFYVYLLEITTKTARKMIEHRLIHIDYFDEADIPIEYKSLLKVEDGYNEVELNLEQFQELLDKDKTSDEQYILFNVEPKKRTENVYHVEF